MRAVFVAVTLALTAPPSAAADLTDNQRQAECRLVEGKVVCPAPGLGRCWTGGHDPNLDQPAASLDVGGDPASPDHGHAERCSGYTAAAAALGAEPGA